MMCFILPTLVLMLYLTISSCDVNKANGIDIMNNSSEAKKDMYVVHAVVYQIGIITNKTDNETGNLNSTGEEEALTFFHTNGSNVDLSKIPQPLLTNVTAESMVGLAPSSPFEKLKLKPTWSDKIPQKYVRSITEFKEITEETEKHLHNNNKTMSVSKTKMNTNNFKTSNQMNKDSNDNTAVQIVTGSTVIPKNIGIQALAIPTLLSFSNNLTNIPVPIPNTSVVQYTKINTVAHMP